MAKWSINLVCAVWSLCNNRTLNFAKSSFGLFTVLVLNLNLTVISLFLTCPFSSWSTPSVSKPCPFVSQHFLKIFFWTTKFHENPPQLEYISHRALYSITLAIFPTHIFWGLCSPDTWTHHHHLPSLSPIYCGNTAVIGLESGLKRMKGSCTVPTQLLFVNFKSHD